LSIFSLLQFHKKGAHEMIARNRWEDLRQTSKDEAHNLDRLTTDWLNARASSSKRIFCAAGCSNCCTLFVQATLIEALIVAEQLDTAQTEKLEGYVLRQRDIFAGESDFLAVLRKQRTQIGPCPFLDDAGSCSIYEQRPLACRALLSTKDPAWCGIDFQTLDPLEKRLYLESLEREVVAFPVHYVAHTQSAAQSAEARILEQMRTLPGGAISGNFPLLVYLASTHQLAAQLNGVTNWSQQLLSSPFFHPLLLQIPPADEKPPSPQ
jgi:Fe-S-cluster containining protein